MAPVRGGGGTASLRALGLRTGGPSKATQPMKRFETLILLLLGLLVLVAPVPRCGGGEDAAPDALEAHGSMFVDGFVDSAGTG